MLTSRPQVSKKTAHVSYRKQILIPGFVLLLAAILPAHLRISSDENYAGPLALLDRGFDLVLVCALTSVTFCCGRRLSRLLGLNFFSVAEEVSLSIFIGTGTIGLLIMGCGLAGLLTPFPVIVLLLAILALTLKELPRLCDSVKRGLRAATATRGQHAYLLVLFAGLVVLLIIEAMSPPWTADDIIYHLPATKLFVDHGRIYPLYDNSLGNMPFLIHMIYALCLMARADIAVKLFSLVLSLVTALSLLGFCERFLDRKTGVLAMVAFLGGAMVTEVAVTARVDVSLAGMLFLTTYALMVYLDSAKRAWLYAAGLMGGFSVGIKLTALAWLTLLAIMLVIELFIRKRVSWQAILKDLLILVSLTVVTASPWFIKNVVWFHNPVYPFRTGEVADFDSMNIRYFSAEDERQMDAHFEKVRQEWPDYVKRVEETIAYDASKRPARHPIRFWEYYTNPSAYFLGDYRHYSNYVFLLVPLFSFVPRQKWLSWLLGLSIFFYLLVTSASWIARFLLPIYPPLTVISVYILSSLTKKLTSLTPLAAGVPLYFLAACLAVPLVVSSANIGTMKNLSFIIGNRSRSTFLSEMDNYPAIQFINTNLPSGSRLMLVGTQMGYHIKHEYLAEESWQTTEWRRLLAANASMEEISADLKHQGITHILFSPSLYRFAVRTGWEGAGGVQYMFEDDGADERKPEYVVLRNWVTFDAYREHLERIYSDGYGLSVYQLR